jgi:hypothetical protein
MIYMINVGYHQNRGFYSLAAAMNFLKAIFETKEAREEELHFNVHVLTESEYVFWYKLDRKERVLYASAKHYELGIQINKYQQSCREKWETEIGKTYQTDNRKNFDMWLKQVRGRYKRYYNVPENVKIDPETIQEALEEGNDIDFGE